MKKSWHKISARFFGQNVLIVMLFLGFLFPASNVQGVEASLLQLEWRYGTFGAEPGRNGLNVFDIDGDGIKEVVLSGAHATFWYVVKQTSSAIYTQSWVSDMYPSGIARIVVSDVDSNGVGEIYVGLFDGTVIVYDGLTILEIGSFKAANTISTMTIADADGDGNEEIVISDGSKIFVYSADTYSLEWASAFYGGSSLAIGNVDTDPAPEIITTMHGGHGYVIDGVSHNLQWDYINSFGRIIELGDIDGDGMNEIIGAAAWEKITIFDADIKSPKWEITTDLNIESLNVTDTDGDGIPEIIYGDGQWGSIHCYDAGTLEERWHIDNPGYEVTGIALGDVNNDGVLEVIWGAGATISGSDMYIADTITHQIKWESLNIDEPLSAVDAGDVDDDGKNEIVMVSFESESGYNAGVIHIFDAVTHELEWRHTLDNNDWMGVRSVKIGDVDGDGETEFVVTTGNLYNGFIQVYNGRTHALERQSAEYSGNYFTSLAIGDVDNDGETEIVAGQGIEAGSDGTHLIVFDGLTLEEKWKSIRLESNYWGEIYDIKQADVDNDGHIEIIASVDGLRIYVFDGVTHQLKWLAAIPAYALEVSDVNFDGRKDILIGRDDGVVDAYDGISFSLMDSFTLGAGRINGLMIDDINNGGRNEWLVSELPEHPWMEPSKMSVYDGITKTLLWQKANLGASISNFNHLISLDLDNDQKKEIIFGSSYALHQFEASTDNIIAVIKSGAGTGAVTSTPAGIDCGTDCLTVYNEDAVVTFTATADSGSFAKWDGDCSGCGTNPDCSITMDADKTCTAIFDPDYYPLTVVKSGTGAGIVTSNPTGINCGADCLMEYGENTVVALSATAVADSLFVRWSGDCSACGTNTDCNITVAGARLCTATFNLENAYSLIVTKPGTGGGTVTSKPTGINCGTDCSEPYPKAAKTTNVTLKVKPDAYSTFLGWGGDCLEWGTKQTCTVKMNYDRNVTVSFGLPDISVSLNSFDFGNVVVKQSSSPATFTIHNNGTGNLKITKIKVVGTDAKMFRIKGGGKKTIAPGGAHQFTVIFKPTAAGNKSAIVQILSNDSDTPTIDVPLSGAGNI